MEVLPHGFEPHAPFERLAMKLDYSSRKLRKLCEDEREMHKRRPDIERTLRIRVAALAANNSLGDLCANDPLGEWHRLTGDRLGQWAGKVSANERIVIEPQEYVSSGYQRSCNRQRPES